MFVKEETRELARIVTIDELKPIPKADRLEIAMVGGWECIVLKGMYKVGDPAVYFEIDASIPLESPVWGDFDKVRLLVKTDQETKEQFAVIKTLRLRGVLSQGLLLSVDHLANTPACGKPVGTDITQLLGVIKYVSPDEWKLYQARLAPTGGGSDRHAKGWWWKLRTWMVKGIICDGLIDFPRGHVKSEEDRIQNMAKHYPKMVEEGDEYEASYKLDGESGMVYKDLDNGQMGIAQRNWALRTEPVPYTLKESILVYIAAWMRFVPRRLRGGQCDWPVWRRQYEPNSVPLVKFMNESGVVGSLDYFNTRNETGIPGFDFCKGKKIAIQGEMVGPRFNGGAEGTVKNQFFIYRVYGNGNYTFPPAEARAIAEYLQVPYVPLMSTGMKLPATIQELLKMADGKSHFHSDRLREGLVLKNNRTGQSFKVISNKWLEAKDKEAEAAEKAAEVTDPQAAAAIAVASTVIQ